ncbi:MAG: four helix bundle protein [Candidatus Magasanikbacteria bacterium CG10_big_fil_rev_8_21_14_0_10_43_9]|nr:MAG: four helix bundle protein [Candidatus Magasanikbacteria bacterium CG10_big_fil_rev_8_21_14_0_10_43_9]
MTAWQKGHALVLMVHEMIQIFPKHEQYALSNQLWRAVVSITSNIAEGFRRESYKDKAHFYTMSLSSLSEIQNQLLIARDVGYINTETFMQIANQTVEVSTLLKGLIKATKRHF